VAHRDSPSGLGFSCFAPLASPMPLGVRHRHEGGAVTSAPLGWELDGGPHPHTHQVVKGCAGLRLSSPWVMPSFERTGHSPLRTGRTPCSVYGSPSLDNVLEAVLFNRAAFACPPFPAWNPRTVSLPLSDALSSVLPRLIRWLIQILWLLNPLQANVGYYGDSVAIQVFTRKRNASLGNPAFQHE
jgi:hypothetical protein